MDLRPPVTNTVFPTNPPFTLSKACTAVMATLDLMSQDRSRASRFPLRCEYSLSVNRAPLIS
jgi:hypothetical protein